MKAKNAHSIYKSIVLAFIILFTFQVILGETFFVHEVNAETPPPPVTSQTPTKAPTKAPTQKPPAGPTPTVYPTLSDFSAYEGNVKISLSQIKYPELVFSFPETRYLYLSLPDQWQLSSSSTFTIHYSLFDQWENQVSDTQRGLYSPPGMKIYVNDYLASSFNPEIGPDKYHTFEIPYQAIERINNNPTNSFTFTFEFEDDDDFYCDYNGILKIHDDSTFNVGYTFMPPNLDLSRFPKPISQDSSLPETIYFIVPDNYNGSELSAAATTAAMITKNTGSSVTYKIFRESDRMGIPEKANVVIIGTPSRNTYLREVLYKPGDSAARMPSTLSSGNKIYITSASRLLSDDEGLIQIMPSVRNQRFSYLVVTGNADKAVELAARGLSSPPIGQVGAGFIVSPTFKIPEYKLDNVVTLKSLGFSSVTSYGRGIYSVNIPFYVPRNWKMEPGTSLILRYRNSDNLDETNSLLAVYLNNQPSGTARIDLKTTGEKTITIPINPTDIRAGWLNILRIEATKEMLRLCNYNHRSFFISIQETSLLNLPHSLITDPKELSPLIHPIYYMGTKPSIYVSLPTKPAQDDLNMLMSFASLFSTLRLPTVDYHVALDPKEDLTGKTGYNILMIGQPSTNPQFEKINKFLPQQFVSGADTLQQMVGDVTYQVPPGISIGIVEVINSPFDPEMGLTLISGTSKEGIQYVYDTLTQSPALEELIGDVIFIGKETIQGFTTNGRSVALDLASSGVTGTKVALEVVSTVEVTPVPGTTQASKYTSNVSTENPVSQMIGKYLLIGLIIAGLIVLFVAISSTARGGRRS